MLLLRRAARGVEMVIAKRGYQWVLYTKDKRRILGKFRTKKEALKRERQIVFFKYAKGRK